MSGFVTCLVHTSFDRLWIVLVVYRIACMFMDIVWYAFLFVEMLGHYGRLCTHPIAPFLAVGL